ncbi:MAG: HlyD family efflux transporter periplasmic adaptor subunit [Terracidiphilus sp.]|jgi:HlyD family secretion protein
MAEERKQSSRLWLWLGAAVLVVIVYFVARSLTRERLPVREARVGRQELVSNISTNGRVEPVVNYPVSSPIATTVRTIFVQQGDHVQAGKLLLELDDVQARARVASAESGVKSAQAALEAAAHNGSSQERQASATDIERARIDRDQASHDLEALTKLKAAGAASASEVTAAQERLDSAGASLNAAQQNAHSRYAPIDVARAQAALADAEAGLAAARDIESKTAPHSPIAATVYSVNAGRSDFVEEGHLLMQLADLGNLRVRAYFDQPLIGQLAVGQPVQIKWDGDPRPGHVWTGRVARTPSTVVQYTTRTVGETIIAIDGGDGGLLPDTDVTVTVTTSSEPNALTVPREALHIENGKPFVFKVVDGELVRTPVTVGVPSLTLAPIVSGLQEGDIVATGSTNGLPLQDGIPIKEMQ